MAYADKNYDRSKAIYDVLAQVMEDIKYGVSNSSAGETGIYGGSSWNRLVADVEGVTIRFLGENHLELTFHRFENATVEELTRDEIDKKGEKYLKEVAKALKKGFKSYTKKTLKLKDIKIDRKHERTSRLQADTSWQTGSSRYGHRSPVSRYLVRDSIVYEFSASL